MADHVYYGGVEGGASHSSFSLVRSDGKVIATSSGESTNQYLIGLDECIHRIKKMADESLVNAGLPNDTTLEGLGMSLSGGDETAGQIAIKEATMSLYPKLAKNIFVGSDTQSALATALPTGGIVLIAGTGSNCQLINEDGSKARCGGWGHMIGDQASACWITLKAIKSVFDHQDRMNICPYPIGVVKEAIFEYFQIKEEGGLLNHLYKDFNKTAFSGCCKKLAEVGIQTKDPLCLSVFQEAGKLLAKHLCAVSGHTSKDLKERDGGVPVVCVGSVFKSWDLLQTGFTEEMKLRVEETGITQVSLIRLKTDASIGAAALGAKTAGTQLPFDYENNSSLFYKASFK